MRRPSPPPEGALISEALERSDMSAREAARRSNLSEGRWRQIINGYQTAGGGNYVPVRGPAKTVARMAHVVGLSPDDLVGANREDAAKELTKRLESRDETPGSSADYPPQLTGPAERDLWDSLTRSGYSVERRWETIRFVRFRDAEERENQRNTEDQRENERDTDTV